MTKRISISLLFLIIFALVIAVSDMASAQRRRNSRAPRVKRAQVQKPRVYKPRPTRVRVYHPKPATTRTHRTPHRR